MTLLPESWSAPLKLRNNNFLPTSIFPAPMEGVTEGVWLDAMSQSKLVPFWVTPFIRISTGVPGRGPLQDFLAPFKETGVPIIVQLMGTHAGRMAETAQRLADLGIIGIDLNCACPIPKIVSNGAGGKCLKDPEWIANTLNEIKSAVPNNTSVTVKLRSGFDDAAEMNEILSIVQDSSVDAVTLHWRTVKELYHVMPPATRGERLLQARKLLDKTPLIVCGDIFTLKDAMEVASCGCDGVAPARGLLQNPWIIQEFLNATKTNDQEAITLKTNKAQYELLIKICEVLCSQSAKNTGKILQLSGMMLGRDSDIFRTLVGFKKPIEILEYLHKLV